MYLMIKIGNFLSLKIALVYPLILYIAMSVETDPVSYTDSWTNLRRYNIGNSRFIGVYIKFIVIKSGNKRIMINLSQRFVNQLYRMFPVKCKPCQCLMLDLIINLKVKMEDELFYSKTLNGEKSKNLKNDF